MSEAMSPSWPGKPEAVLRCKGCNRPIGSGTVCPRCASLYAAANGPVCAQSQRWPRKVHAVPGVAVAKAARSRRRTVTALCGVQHLRLIGDDGVPALFPPANDVLERDDLERCGACFAISGKPAHRPGRSVFRRAS